MKISEVLKKSMEILSEHNIENPHLDAQVIIAHVLETEPFRLTVNAEEEIPSNKIKTIQKLIQRRCKHEPVAYITGSKEFYAINFLVNKSTLIPRPETELLVDMAIYYAPLDAKILDIGTGSGAIAIAVKLSRNDLKITAVDISSKALSVAKENAKNILANNDIKFLKSDLFEKLENFKSEKFGLIVSNPPYVDINRKNELALDLMYEPDEALFTEDKGLAIIKKIISQSKEYLTDDGILLLEIGEGQKNEVTKLGLENGFDVSVLSDYSGLPRIAICKRLKSKK